jgi:hypothetical protein
LYYTNRKEKWDKKLILFYKMKIILFGGANVPLKGIIATWQLFYFKVK